MIIICIIVPIIFAAVCYLMTLNLIVSLLIFLISLFFFLFYVKKKYQKYNENIRRIKECALFINSYIVSLDTSPSLKIAFDYVSFHMSEEYLRFVDGINELNEKEKLEYLSKYFPYHIYYLFLNLVDLFIDQGGDILTMSTYLLNETKRIDYYVINVTKINKQSIVDVGILWFVSLLILICMRFALSQYYELLTKQIYYPICIALFFLLILSSIFILMKKITKLDIKEIYHE